MKKYIIVFLLAISILGFGAKAQAVTFDDLLQEITNLKQQISGLRTELSAAVLRATVPATQYQAITTTAVKEVPATSVMVTKPVTNVVPASSIPTTSVNPTAPTVQTMAPTTQPGPSYRYWCYSVDSSGNTTSWNFDSDTDYGERFQEGSRDFCARGFVSDSEINSLVKSGGNSIGAVKPFDGLPRTLSRRWENGGCQVYDGNAWIGTTMGFNEWNCAKTISTSSVKVPQVAISTTTTSSSSTPASPSVSSGAAIAFSHNLIAGERSEEVRALQSVLISLGYLPSTSATGLYGKATIAAIKNFQMANGISGDGTVVGPKTKAAFGLHGGPIVATPFPGTNHLLCFTGSGTPQIRVITPNGGETYQQGQQITVKWQTCNAPANAVVMVSLDYYANGITSGATLVPQNQVFGGLSTPTQNDGQETFTIPTPQINSVIVPGSTYKIRIALATGSSVQNLTTLVDDRSDNYFTITGQSQGVCAITTPTLAIASSTAPQYIAAGGNGAVDGTKMTLFVSPTAGTPVITELKFTQNGPGVITSVKVGNVTAPVVSGVAWLTGLNIPVSSGGTFIDAYISYAPVSVSGISSNTTSSIALTYVKYTCGGTTSTITPAVYAPTMTLVGSVPGLTVNNSSVNNGLLIGAENKIGQVTVSANAKGNIKINDLVFNYNFGNFNALTLSNARIADGTTNIAGSSCGVSQITDVIFCEFSTIGNTQASGTNAVDTESNADFDGYVIAAGTSKTFSLYATVMGSTNGPGFVSTKLNQSGFNWDDTATTTFVGDGFAANSSGGINLNGQLIYNFPTGTYVIQQ